MLPNLIVIGAAKCGTTSLHRYLDLHPEVAMSRTKELNFFSAGHDDAGLRWYEAQFTEDAPVRGESSPAYTRHPRYRGTPARLARVVPDVRLVYIVRDPVERFFSSYRFNRHALRERDEDLDVLLADLDSEQSVWSSSYGFQLGLYLEHFPLERVLILDHADLAERRAETMARLFRWLGVDDAFESPGFEHRHNPTDGAARPNWLGRATIGTSKRLLGERRTSQLRTLTPHGLVPFLLHRPEIPEVVVDPALRARLEDRLRPDAARFRELTGLRFDHWCV